MRARREGGFGWHRQLSKYNAAPFYALAFGGEICFDPATMKYTLKALLAILFAGFVSACSALPGESPAYDTIAADKARLLITAPALAGVRAVHLKAVRREAGYRVERARWDASAGSGAELMLIEALNPKGLDLPDDPRDELINFITLIDLKARFGELYQSDTGMGPAMWRRFTAGGRACVIFLQRWDDGPKTPVIRTLFGYYCAAPGGTFTLHDAQSVLKTVYITAG
jgi:hypothetical protein